MSVTPAFLMASKSITRCFSRRVSALSTSFCFSLIRLTASCALEISDKCSSIPRTSSDTATRRSLSVLLVSLSCFSICRYSASRWSRSSAERGLAQVGHSVTPESSSVETSSRLMIFLLRSVLVAAIAPNLPSTSAVSVLSFLRLDSYRLVSFLRIFRRACTTSAPADESPASTRSESR